MRKGVKGKIVYLFETGRIISNEEGRYMCMDNKLYLFSEAPKHIFDLSNKVLQQTDFITPLDI